MNHYKKLLLNLVKKDKKKRKLPQIFETFSITLSIFRSYYFDIYFFISTTKFFVKIAKIILNGSGTKKGINPSAMAFSMPTKLESHATPKKYIENAAAKLKKNNFKYVVALALKWLTIKAITQNPAI
jgi:hypothetical protein